MGITLRTVSKCSSLSSSIRNAEMKLKINGIIMIKNINSNGKFAARGNMLSILGAIKCIIILEKVISITGYAKNANKKKRSRMIFLKSLTASFIINTIFLSSF
jgi:hypothetical protein